MFVEQLEKALSEQNTAVLIISMQNEYLRDVVKQDLVTLINNHKILLDLSINMKLPIIFGNKYISGQNGLVHKNLRKYLVAPKVGEYLRPKEDWGFFWNPNIKEELELEGIEHLFLTGVYASYCVYKTAEQAIKNGFKISSGSFFMRNKSAPINHNYYKDVCLHYIE